MPIIRHEISLDAPTLSVVKFGLDKLALAVRGAGQAIDRLADAVRGKKITLE